MGTKSTVDQLNAFLRDELIAIDTYQQALKGRSAFSGKTELSQCQISHENRAKILREQIALIGGKPVTSEGIKGVVAKVVEGGAVALSDNMAIKTLEQFEQQEMKDYRKHTEELDAPAREIVEMKLVPEQEATLRTMADLARRAARA